MAGINLFAAKAGGTSGEVVALNDEYGYTYLSKGATVPTDTASGYAKGCIFVDTDGAAGSVLYINEGTSSSCDFNAINPTGSTTAYNDISDPSASGSISFAAYTGTYTSTTANWNGMIFENTNVSPTAGANLLTLKYTADGDANGIFLSCIDNAGADTKFQIGADGATVIAGTATGTAALTITAGDIQVTDGKINLDTGNVQLSADNTKLTLGASDATDSYITFTGTDLTFYDSTLGATRTLSQLAGGGLVNPTITGDMTITDGKFTWTDAVAEAAGVWTFAGTTTTDIAISSKVTTGGVITATANDVTSGTIFKAISTAAGLTTGNYFEANEDGATVFEVAVGGVTTIAGTAGSNSFILTAGDAVMSDGSLTITDADPS